MKKYCTMSVSKDRIEIFKYTYTNEPPFHCVPICEVVQRYDKVNKSNLLKAYELLVKLNEEITNEIYQDWLLSHKKEK